MDNIYFNNIVKKKVIVNPKYLGTIDNYIENYLKKNFEGKCIAEGYVKPETIKIVRRGIGSITGSRFNGDITYIIEYSAEICNPSIGNVIECTVKNINKLGLLCVNGPITVIVGKKFHDNLEDINKIKEGDVIKVEIIAKKIQLNKEEIQVVGKIYNSNNSIKKVVKKTMINSDITSIDAIDSPLYKNNSSIKNTENNMLTSATMEEDEEEEDVDYNSDMSLEEDLEEDLDEDLDEDIDDENIKFGDINFTEPEDEKNIEDEDDEEDEDEDEDDEGDDEDDYDYK